MYVLPIPREQLLHLLPKGGKTAEIGVFKGNFSRHIIDVTKPCLHHMIDPWSVWEGSNEHYEEVQTKFFTEVAEGKVILHKDLSENVAETIEDRSLDWVYIDGDHSYSGAMKDLLNFAPKVKYDGLILGHDYVDQVAENSDATFGVVKAVNDFVRETGYVFIAMTSGLFPTFILAASTEAPLIKKLIESCLLHIPGTIEIKNYPGDRDTLFKLIKLSNGKTIGVPSF